MRSDRKGDSVRIENRGDVDRKARQERRCRRLAAPVVADFFVSIPAQPEHRDRFRLRIDNGCIRFESARTECHRCPAYTKIRDSRLCRGSLNYASGSQYWRCCKMKLVRAATVPSAGREVRASRRCRDRPGTHAGLAAVGSHPVLLRCLRCLLFKSCLHRAGQAVTFHQRA
jgi:hypothetical protein